RAFSRRLEGDAFSQGDPEERAREDAIGILMFKVGLNCELAKEHHLWNSDLQDLWASLERAESGSSDTQATQNLARLIARVELALTEAAVEYTPATSHLSD